MYGVHEMLLINKDRLRDARREILRSRSKHEAKQILSDLRTTTVKFDMSPEQWNRISMCVDADGVRVMLDGKVVLTCRCTCLEQAQHVAPRIRVLCIDNRFKNDGLTIDWGSGIGFCDGERGCTGIDFRNVGTSL